MGLCSSLGANIGDKIIPVELFGQPNEREVRVRVRPFSIHDLSSIFNKSNTTGATCGAGTAYPSEHQSSLPVFSGVRFP